ncbi:hypothetical protein [Desulfitobacterium chlororespirans]|uniref:Uncharacterized protein n=1 Tax=Desulfitobacterium chlororespirans DSM 11544 TaxID=1121395 RepID=A0A1M7U755_9FIRM|nr:hypothetical protein [Desulfitobacterium chlororespirans]SHN78746.1 hypothetical protein SAMN02745215_03128 [Desulfitobacterium chlororespirans DSM 11544]
MVRSISFILAVVILLTCTSSIFVNFKEVYKVEIITKSADYKKVKITNTETGKVEYLESVFDENGLHSFVSISEEGTFVIRGTQFITVKTLERFKRFGEIESTKIENGVIGRLLMKQNEYNRKLYNAIQ